MSVFQDIRSVSPDISTQDLLRLLIDERFAGKMLVTASLKAPSMVVLKLVADIDPATPVVFCVPGFEFPESGGYRKRIVDPLIRWTKEVVRAFMREHKLPFQPRAVRRKPALPLEKPSLLPAYNY